MPDGLAAKEISHLPCKMGEFAEREMDNLINARERKMAQDTNKLKEIKVEFRGLLTRLENI